MDCLSRLVRIRGIFVGDGQPVDLQTCSGLDFMQVIAFSAQIQDSLNVTGRDGLDIRLGVKSITNCNY